MMHSQRNIKLWHHLSAFLFNPSLFSWSSDVSCLYEICTASGDLKVISKKTPVTAKSRCLELHLNFLICYLCVDSDTGWKFSFPLLSLLCTVDTATLSSPSLWQRESTKQTCPFAINVKVVRSLKLSSSFPIKYLSWPVLLFSWKYLDFMACCLMKVREALIFTYFGITLEMWLTILIFSN